MTRKAHTADERFIICAYQALEGLNDKEAPLNFYKVGEKAGITHKGVKAICKLLIQANFIKKISDEEIYLTQNGEQLALRLLEE
ncbi:MULTISPECIES: hypothetical protein [unclassified Neochlamydia]|uniref:hypothetical protein n=1 Tax=unclassified Neochlamydia TaxID=2643326 RepID=UPI0014096A47|nr:MULTISPECIES: hypothetical protein [unclassified Neochlamydia]MBS4166704.1 Uncharacterized protein [Neochlamydia sp. AcF65]MBS4171506.1 Uncharacterized protein [Neochlamydia sp. AcF95]NGY95026.1 hypothetical protein [Neochlamydia sp. AcF84]